MMKKQHKLFLVPVLVIFLGAACSNNNVPRETGTETTTENGVNTAVSNTASSLTWQNLGGGDWAPSTTPPACPTPLLAQPPVDLSIATAILYPGQTRGGNYKPHGGFLFRNAKKNAVTVTLPADAEVVDAARYIEAGEVQYLFDFIMPCGAMLRFDHLHTLSGTMQAIADTLPAAQENNSTTTTLQQPVQVSAGTVLATVVGFLNTNNTTMDFGVYNLLEKNAISHNATWSANSQHAFGLAQHAVCWFDSFDSATATRLRALPAGDATSGKASDYCGS